MKKICKYCKSNEHIIDFCPEILCKICNERGHPHWKCKSKNTEIKNSVEDIKIDEFKIVKPYYSELVDTSKLNTVEDYLSIMNISWGNLKL
tara:strand:- start:50 stop:322 length:273 start_codon:yes stop_codon:yes gene_type:complete